MTSILLLGINAFAFERTFLCKVSSHTSKIKLTEYDAISETQSKTFIIATADRFEKYGAELSYGFGLFNGDQTNYRVELSIKPGEIISNIIINQSNGFENTLKIDENRITTEDFLTQMTSPLHIGYGSTEKSDGTFEKIVCSLY